MYFSRTICIKEKTQLAPEVVWQAECPHCLLALAMGDGCPYTIQNDGKPWFEAWASIQSTNLYPQLCPLSTAL